ncbi:hypothetical protein ACFV0L_18945 [Streptosporangium canum]|uniref:hypothetical protein n=1 Tax=Streptosporangium canum TaxID=324952 RepID=UPI0036A5809C
MALTTSSESDEEGSTPELRRCRCCEEEKPLSDFYPRGKKDPRPDSYCKQCRAENFRQWAKENPEARKAAAVRTRVKLRKRVLAHYGGSCDCCGEDREPFLAIDHINGGGIQHRKSLGHDGLGGSFYRWLVKQGFPSGFRVLCHNCNQALGHYGRCPHQDDGEQHGADNLIK